MDKMTNDVRVYTDMESLEHLRIDATKNPNSAKKQVAKEFEAMLMQIVLHSMRDANKALSSGLFDSNQMDLYEDIFDKQLSLIMANNGNGFANLIETNLNNQYGLDKTGFKKPEKTQTLAMPPTKTAGLPLANTEVIKTRVEKTTLFKTPEDFIKHLWTEAKDAAKQLGVDPKILLAQAALETNWGKKIITKENQASTHNLFNIKADASWDKDTTLMATLEQKQGVIVKENAHFRSYASFSESFGDYVNFLKNNGRYKAALNNASNPLQFIKDLQLAGFATDHQYADKVWQIFSSDHFKKMTANFN